MRLNSCSSILVLNSGVHGGTVGITPSYLMSFGATWKVQDIRTELMNMDLHQLDAGSEDHGHKTLCSTCSQTIDRDKC
ncbi:hypothetical protein BDR06DRAFT_960431 [Suillus hirtellus]|nr:hypothetical protein BDR06DRAFT_960431 [Suillus hirtellus]